MSHRVLTLHPYNTRQHYITGGLVCCSGSAAKIDIDVQSTDEKLDLNIYSGSLRERARWSTCYELPDDGSQGLQPKSEQAAEDLTPHPCGQAYNSSTIAASPHCWLACRRGLPALLTPALAPVHRSTQLVTSHMMGVPRAAFPQRSPSWVDAPGQLTMMQRWTSKGQCCPPFHVLQRRLSEKHKAGA